MPAVLCPQCGRQLEISDAERVTGITLQCQQCNTRLHVRPAAPPPARRAATSARPSVGGDDDSADDVSSYPLTRRSGGIPPGAVILATVGLLIGLFVGGVSGYLAGSRSSAAQKSAQAAGSPKVEPAVGAPKAGPAVAAPPPTQSVPPPKATAKAPPVADLPPDPKPEAPPQRAPDDSAQPVAVLSGQALDSEFEKGVKAADLKYRNKLIEVTDVSPRMGVDRGGKHFLTTGDSRQVNENRAGGTKSVAGDRAAIQEARGNARNQPGVYFYIDPTDLPAFDDLPGARSVTIRGVCRGAIQREDLTPGYIVILDKCSLVTATK
jgi:hypothetical protein